MSGRRAADRDRASLRAQLQRRKIRTRAEGNARRVDGWPGNPARRKQTQQKVRRLMHDRTKHNDIDMIINRMLAKQNKLLLKRARTRKLDQRKAKRQLPAPRVHEAAA